MLLTSTSAKYEVFLGAAVTTTEFTVVSTWSDNTTTTYTPGITSTVSNGTTAVVLVPAPGASTQRVVRDVHILNRDTSPGDVTVRYFDGSTNYVIAVITLYPNDTLIWSAKQGWYVMDTKGVIRTNVGTANQVAETRLAWTQSGLAGTNKTLTSTSTFAVYLGRAPQTFNRVIVKFRVTTAAATITWAEAALATGVPVLGGNASLKLLVYEPIETLVDATSVASGPGATFKRLNFAYSGFAGQDLWFLVGNNAVTPMIVASYLQDGTAAGLSQVATARPSTMASPTAFTAEASTVTPVYAVWQLD